MSAKKKQRPAPPIQYAQGDVLIVPVAKIPDGLEAQPATDSLLIAEGEATGHAHVVKSPRISAWGARENLFFNLGQAGAVVHEEHDAIELPAGNYRVIHQREYDGEEGRRVAD
jgi:hypothetical protein